MPYERVDPAAWWHGAEAAPPMPEGEGPWELAPTPYGYAWRRPEPTVSTHRGPMTLDRLRAGLEALHAPESPAPPEPRVGDRVERAGMTARVSAVFDFVATVRFNGQGASVLLSDIGPPGSGRPWTLLPPDAAPAAPALPDAEKRAWVAAYEAGTPFGHRDAPWNKAAVQVHAGGGGGIGPRAFPTGGSYVVGAGGVRHEPAPDAPDAVFDARVVAATEAVRRMAATEPGGKVPATEDRMAVALRAADAVPDPRREAERRVVEAAREWWGIAVERYGDPDSAGRAAEPQPCDLRDALAALAALDGEGGA